MHNVHSIHTEMAWAALVNMSVLHSCLTSITHNTNKLFWLITSLLEKRKEWNPLQFWMALTFYHVITLLYWCHLLMLLHVMYFAYLASAAFRADRRYRKDKLYCNPTKSRKILITIWAIISAALYYIILIQHFL